MKEYKGFAISNFRTGFDEAVEPWLLPRDAYQLLINAHLYRGVLEKIEGYRLFATMSYRTEIAMNGAINGINKVFTVVLPTDPISSQFYGYGTLVLGSTAETFTYDSDASTTLINLIGDAGGTGTVDLNTNTVTLTFNTAPPASAYSTVFFQWDSAVASPNAIMGIKQYFNSNGGQEVMVFDTRRVGTIQSILSPTLISAAGALQSIEEIPHDYYQASVFISNGGVGPYAGNLTATLITPGTVKFFEYTPAGVLVKTITDNGFGALTGTNVNSAASFINYVTGAYTITFTVAPTNLNVFNSTAGVYGDIFSGDFSDFFTLTNYQYKAFFTNSVDEIMYYDGTSLKYLITNLSVKLPTATGGTPNNLDITRCLHVFTLRERLLLIAPTVQQVNEVAGVWWSEALNPLNFTNDEFLVASTSEPIRTFGYINTDLILRFSNSERVFRYTGDAFAPFRFDSTNNLWACDASYSAINYDTWFSSVGRPGIVGSDGVNVKRVDTLIPDFTDPTRLSQQVPVPFINQTSIQQCYGERFDDQKEGWLCYNSAPVDQGNVVASDHVLAYNYLDETYAVYSFPFSCLGFGRIVNVPTWATTITPWDEMSDTWDSYQLQNNALVDLAGDQYDRVFSLNDGNKQTNVAGESIPVALDVITKNFNPFIEEGQLARLGYVDLFVSGYATTKLRVQFYVNDQLYIDSNDQPAGYYQENTLTFNTTDAMSPSTNMTKVWKRIYVGSIGKEHTLRFYQHADDLAETDEQPVFIHAMVLYMKPAGRIFQ